MEISPKSMKLSVKELFTYKVRASRRASNNEFIQRNFSEKKFKGSYLMSCEKNPAFSNGCT